MSGGGREPVHVRGRRVTGLYQRKLKDGTTVYEYRGRLGKGGTSASRTLEAQNPTDAAAEVERLRSDGRVSRSPTRSQPLVILAEAASLWLADFDRCGYEPSTTRAHEIRLRLHILPTLGDVRLLELDERMVRRWARSLPLTLHPVYFKNMVSTLRKTLAFAVAEGWCEENAVNRACERFPRDMRRKHAERFEPRPLSDSELAMLLSCLPATVAPFIEFLALTGLRVNEGRAVRWCDIDLGSSPPTLTVSYQLDEKHQLKRLKTRASAATVALAPDAATLLRAQRTSQMASFGFAAGRDEAFVFTNRAGRPLTYASVSEAWRKHIGRVTEDRVRIHDLRSTFASRLVERNVPLSVAQMLLRHGSIATTERYYIRLRGGDHEKLIQMRKALES